MGGFRIDGCGVADHFKNIKSLGYHRCPTCGRTAEFHLKEAKRKIDVFYIPTFTLKSRYAVMCSKCERGEYCSDERALELIHSNGNISNLFGNEAPAPQVTVQEPEPVPVRETQNTGTHSVPEIVMPNASGGASALFLKCKHCGQTQKREGKFCAFCGKPFFDSSSQDGNVARYCSACGAKCDVGSQFCMECGTRL